jgi:hypothetical protein
MYSQFALMGSCAVEFAKDYRAEQIRTMEASRLATQCMPPRRGLGERLRATHIASHLVSTARAIRSAGRFEADDARQ